MRTVQYGLIAAAALVALVGCRTAGSADVEAPMVLQLLHFADVDGNQDDALDSVDEFSAIVNALKADPTYGPNTLLVSSGDNILPGPRFSLATDPLVTAVTGGDAPAHLDIFWMNELGVAASALGNHELDQGPATLAAALAEDGGFSGSRFPYLSANVDWGRSFDVGRNGRDVGDLAGQVASYATVTVAGQRIGL
ncbi:MAG: hypothetical protein MI724_12200, partial [Spirochaetales bacterium]|nr:hypothetical protein [Spirochaetales bacterium]